jgi:crooked neck
MSSRPQPVDFERLAKQSEENVAKESKPPSLGRAGAAKVKNKQPAPMQITAEQIIREAVDRQEEVVRPPIQQIVDMEELEDERLRKRKGFEDALRRSKFNITTYLKYAEYEETQKQYDRVRSVFERALDIDYRNVNIWVRYAETEMRGKFINHARNIWDRAVSLLPRINQLWYKYAHMEEMLGNVAGARAVFERWMEWQPYEKAYKSYIKFELRYYEIERARVVLKRFVRVHNTIDSWLYFADFEERHGDVDTARQVYADAIDDLFGSDENVYFGEEAQQLYVRFAQFEEKHREVERARVIYKYALDHIPKQFASDVYKSFMNFEKQFGDREGIEQVILGKKRFEYEQEIQQNPYNYDVYFSYIQLEQENITDKNYTRIREVFERAIAQVPPIPEKRLYRRYIYLWMHYALFEELTAEDVERTRQVYKSWLGIIPHSQFSFSKIWILAARFEIRQRNLSGARKIFGQGLGMCPKKDKIFREYIKMEVVLGNVDRARILFEKHLEYNSANAIAWKNYAELENKLGEKERAGAVFELAVNQITLDMPEVIWKSYLDFEISCRNVDKVRELYKRLLGKTQHVKVWLSLAAFEQEHTNDIQRAREVFERAHDHFKKRAGSLEGDVDTEDEEAERDRKEQRVQLLEKWLEFEQTVGDEERIDAVNKMLPDRIRKVRRIMAADGSATAGKEEYIDYVFPDEKATQKTNLEILKRAHQWKLALQKKNAQHQDK